MAGKKHLPQAPGKPQAPKKRKPSCRLEIPVVGGHILFQFRAAQDQTLDDLKYLKETMACYMTDAPEVSALWGDILKAWRIHHPRVKHNIMPFPVILDKNVHGTGPSVNGIYYQGELRLPSPVVSLNIVYHEGIHALRDYKTPGVGMSDPYTDPASWAFARLMVEAEAFLGEFLRIQLVYKTPTLTVLKMADFVAKNQHLSPDDLRRAFAVSFYEKPPEEVPELGDVLSAVSSRENQEFARTFNYLRDIKASLPPEDFEKQAVPFFFDHCMGPGSSWFKIYTGYQQDILIYTQASHLLGAYPENPDRLSLEDFMKQGTDRGYIPKLIQDLTAMGVTRDQIQTLQTAATQAAICAGYFGEQTKANYRLACQEGRVLIPAEFIVAGKWGVPITNVATIYRSPEKRDIVVFSPQDVSPNLPPDILQTAVTKIGPEICVAPKPLGPFNAPIVVDTPKRPLPPTIVVKAQPPSFPPGRPGQGK